MSGIDRKLAENDVYKLNKIQAKQRGNNKKKLVIYSPQLNSTQRLPVQKR